MSAGNFNWFLHTMLFMHTMDVIERQKQRDGELNDENENESERQRLTLMMNMNSFGCVVKELYITCLHKYIESFVTTPAQHWKISV